MEAEQCLGSAGNWEFNAPVKIVMYAMQKIILLILNRIRIILQQRGEANQCNHESRRQYDVIFMICYVT